MDSLELLALLKQERDVLAKLIDITKNERKAILERNLKALKEALEHKEKLKGYLIDLEKKRISFTGDKKLTELLEYYSGNKKNELLNLGREIKEMTRNLKGLNDTNELIIKCELSYFRKVQEALNPHKEVTLYNKDALLKNKSVNTSLLMKSYS